MVYEKLTGIKGVFSTRVADVTANQQGDGRLYSLVVADQDGFNKHTIMESTDPIMSPAWSPDSRQLAYVSFENNRSSIWVQTLRTGNRFRVSSEPGINGAPSFSPDGRKLVITLGGVDVLGVGKEDHPALLAGRPRRANAFDESSQGCDGPGESDDDDIEFGVLNEIEGVVIPRGVVKIGFVRGQRLRGLFERLFVHPREYDVFRHEFSARVSL